MEKKTRIVFFSAKSIITIFLIAVICVGGSFINKKIHGKHIFGFLDNIVGKDGVVNVEETTATLTDVIKRSQLYTVEYPYNGYCPVVDRDAGGDIVYYVCYEGKVKAGIDVNKIDVKVTKDGKEVIVNLPKVDIEEPTVNESTLEFLFYDDSYNNHFAYTVGHQAAVDDLKKKIEEKGDIDSTATESAKDVVRAMVQAWIDADGSDIKLTVNGYGEVK